MGESMELAQAMTSWRHLNSMNHRRINILVAPSTAGGTITQSKRKCGSTVFTPSALITPMKPKNLIDRIYLGDRGCKQCVYNNESKELRIQVDCISFLRPGSSIWDYYSEHDLQDGWIVLSGVDKLTIDPSNIQPNDFIFEIRVEIEKDSIQREKVTISTGGVDAEGKLTDILISAIVEDAHIEDSRGKLVSPPI